jgi:hypothetical protein
MVKVVELSQTLHRVLVDAVNEALNVCAGENITPETIGKVAARLALKGGFDVEDCSGDSASLIKNIPRAKTNVDARIYSAALGSLFGLGDIFQYSGKSSTRVQLFEAQDNGAANTNATRQLLPLHNDVAVMPPLWRAHSIGLLPTVNEADTPTTVAPLEAMLQRVPDRVIEYAMTQAFEIKAPASLGLGNEAWFVRPLIELFDQRKIIGCPTYSVRPRDPGDWDAITAIGALKAAGEQYVQHVVIEPGSFLCVNNIEALHGRGATFGYRKMFRSYFSRSIAQLREAQPASCNDIFDASALLNPKELALRIAA